LILVKGGRGCPFSCTFCTTSSFWGRKYRVKDVELLVNEMKIFNQKYNVSKFSIQHDMFTAKRKHVMDFCNTLINEELGFDWTCSSRIDVLDKDLLDTMKQANCTSIYLGIETGSKRMQKILAKNLNLDEAFEMIKYLKEIRMRMTISFIYCFPDETVDDFKETIKLVEKILKLGITDVQMNRFMPLPSTTETSKVEDVMYFDEKYIELSMNNVKFHDKDIKDMLIKYPRMFSQYYTFDSEVKDKYKRFDNLIELISAMSEFYINTIINLINKYGLEKLYFFMEDILDKIYSITQEDEVSLRVNPDLTYKIARINQELEPFIMHEVEKDNHLFVKEIFRYENNKLQYFVQKKSDPLLLKFKINIEEMIFNQKIIVEDYYIKYSVKGREVITTHLIPVPKKKLKIMYKGVYNMNYSQMVVILGNKCTAKCEMCCLNASPQCNEKIDYKQISEYILSSKEMPEIKIIHFSGGEAFLYYKDLLSLIRLCTDIEKSTSVITNGFWATNYEITLQRLKELKEAGLYAIGVSYDEFHAKFISINNIKNILRASKELDLRTSVQAVIINGSENGDWIDMLGEDIADVIVNFITCDNVGEATINLNDSQFIRNIRSDGCVCRKGGTF
jgi:MoaA/NifB/PqqE/SkfB family radical SAM enzyme